MDTQQIVLTVLAFAVLLAIFFIKEAINKKKGESGEDMEKIRRVVAKLLPDSASYTVAYAYYQKKKYAGNRTTTYYYHYAIAFKPGALFVAPITYDDGELGYKSGAVLTKENLGQVKLDGAETVLFDKTGKQLCIIRVDASNTRQGKYEPFNVQQKEQADAYNAFLKAFAGEINAASGC